MPRRPRTPGNAHISRRVLLAARVVIGLIFVSWAWSIGLLGALTFGVLK